MPDRRELIKAKIKTVVTRLMPWELDKIVEAVMEADTPKCPVCGADITAVGHLCGGRSDFGGAGGSNVPRQHNPRNNATSDPGRP